MAQLVARFHGMEEVGGSNPPSSTEKSDTRLRVSVFLLIDEAAAGFFFLARLSVWVGFSSASWLLTCSPCNVIGCGEVRSRWCLLGLGGGGHGNTLAQGRGGWLSGSSHFGVWGWCSKRPGDRGQCRGMTIEHRSSPWAPHQPKVARNLGTLTFHRYQENRRIPTM